MHKIKKGKGPRYKKHTKTDMETLSRAVVDVRAKFSAGWVSEEKKRLKRLWNFGPFERKMKQFNEALETNGCSIIQNIHPPVP